MKTETGRSTTPNSPTRKRKLSCSAAAAAIAGSAVVLAVTPMLARGLVQAPAGLVDMPATLKATASLSAGLPRFEPSTMFRAEQAAVVDRFHRVARIAPNGGRTEPAAARFADIDASRFTVETSPAETIPVLQRYVWIDRAPDAPSYQLASLEDRFAPARLSGLPELLIVSEPDAAEIDDGFSVEVPTPVQRPEAPVAIAKVETETPDPVVLPERRPARAADAKPRPTRTELAYANPNAAIEDNNQPSGVFGRLFGKQREASGLPERGSKIAVYEIASATVYMPNGEKLEAHSGLAHMKDNPRFVQEKNKGPTPPNLYNLRMRESRFHGVEAIRLLPADGVKKFNRDGLLAHTYMYIAGGGRDRSQSNGCVVFKDYNRFLAAFKRGEVERLIVVRSMKELPTYMAAL